ncbi:patatin-like phospholipase family protein, partial [Bacillus pseudomycoides]
MKIDGVFEGGGVRGIAHVGAICALAKQGYECERVAGTSAGAIIAALLAAGYSCEELKTI